MGLEEELALIKLLKKYDMNCIHRLRQSTITDFLRDKHPSISEKTRYWLDRNRQLPRESYTFEVDVFAWKPNHWGALSIEQKSQHNSTKTLHFENNGFNMHNGKAEFSRSANDLYLQCVGSAYLGKAYAASRGMERMVIPVGVVDYDIDISDTASKWVFHDGVVFVHNKDFEEFLQGFLRQESWVQQLVQVSCT